MKFEDSHKIVKEILDGNSYIPFGVSEVKLNIATADKTDSGKEFIEVHVVDSEDREDSARIWFTTEKAANYGFNILRAIIIHNTPEDKRDAMTAKISKLPDTDALAALLNETCTGKQLWFTKYYDETRTYERDGKTRRQINRNVYGYQPKERPELMPTQQTEDAPAEDVPFGPGEPARDDVQIPAKGDWSS